MKPLDAFFIETGSRDLKSMIGKPLQATWKTAPSLPWLLRMAPLIQGYAKVTSKLVLSSKKLRLALLKVNEKEKINYTKKDDDDYVDLMDDAIRLACKQFRDLKKDPMLRERFFNLAAAAERKAIEQVLDTLEFDVHAAVVEEGRPPATPSSWGGRSSSENLGEGFVADEMPLQDVVPGGEAALAPNTKSIDLSIFNRVLEKKPLTHPRALVQAIPRVMQALCLIQCSLLGLSTMLRKTVCCTWLRSSLLKSRSVVRQVRKTNASQTKPCPT